MEKKYHCPFSDICRYGLKFPERQRYQIIEKSKLGKPVFKDKWLKRNKYKCKALEKENVSCSWKQQLNMTDLSMAMSFTALKNTDAIAYALKMTKDSE